MYVTIVSYLLHNIRNTVNISLIKCLLLNFLFIVGDLDFYGINCEIFELSLRAIFSRISQRKYMAAFSNIYESNLKLADTNE